jgi:hypothetical protein
MTLKVREELSKKPASYMQQAALDMQISKPEAELKMETLSSKSSSSCFFACLFNSEDGGGTFLRNVD